MANRKRVKFPDQFVLHEENFSFKKNVLLQDYGHPILRLLVLADAKDSAGLSQEARCAIEKIKSACDEFFEFVQTNREDHRIAYLTRSLAILYRRFKKNKIGTEQQVKHIKTWLESAKHFVPINQRSMAKMVYRWDLKSSGGPEINAQKKFAAHLGYGEKTVERILAKVPRKTIVPAPGGELGQITEATLLFHVLTKVFGVHVQSTNQIIETIQILKSEYDDQEIKTFLKSKSKVE